MGRSNGGSRSPIRFILNLSKAVATNVYLNLYPKADLAECLDDDARRMEELLQVLNAIPIQDVLDAGRSYGGGLHKIEPRELTAVQLTQVPQWLRLPADPQLALI